MVATICTWRYQGISLRADTVLLTFSMVSLQEDIRNGSSITASRIPAASTQEPVWTPALMKA